MDRGYVLHSYPYRETSLILQVWTEAHGRLGLVAKGARRPKSANRSLLVPFQPLSLDWFGRGELKTLKTAEPGGPGLPLAGAALLAAFYLNELLLKLTHRDDPHEALFAAYDDAISALRELSKGAARSTRLAPEAVEPVLRRFEVRMLRELGYALELAREAGTHEPIVAEREYHYLVERGPVPAPEGREPGANAVRLRGLTLQHLERGQFDDPATCAQAKHLMRLIINHFLDGEELATRSLVRDLQRIGEGA
ncbi:DNA repair protein RecO [Usitatibacter palustris]|uniref:DNA repair protein RecO n=1 Tax=Usitatibacter palustris TaxID=2732487 RepID=A0A6M4H6P5_9PROT|nr:DNA repair protein RecO [Usitatibacter palustris]QJR15301.1 DNA repair protein RecO [Usitatibacter palustris]